MTWHPMTPGSHRPLPVHELLGWIDFARGGLLAGGEEVPISPETLKAAAELLRALSAPADVHAGERLLTPGGVTAIASLIGAILWPVLVLALALLFRDEIRGVMRRLTRLEAPGIKAELESELEKSAHAAALAPPGLSDAPSPGELQRAQQLEQLIGNTGLAAVQQQVIELSSEYERVRASMPSGIARTRAMEVVISKMRTIGRAALPLRHELAASPSPGQRLLVIASLQVMPDFEDFLGWLADRVGKERPFVEYHALVALAIAAADSRAAGSIRELEAALATVSERTAKLPDETGRRAQVRALAARVAHLKGQGPYR